MNFNLLRIHKRNFYFIFYFFIFPCHSLILSSHLNVAIKKSEKNNNFKIGSHPLFKRCTECMYTYEKFTSVTDLEPVSSDNSTETRASADRQIRMQCPLCVSARKKIVFDNIMCSDSDMQRLYVIHNTNNCNIMRCAVCTLHKHQKQNEITDHTNRKRLTTKVNIVSHNHLFLLSCEFKGLCFRKKNKKQTP